MVTKAVFIVTVVVWHKGTFKNAFAIRKRLLEKFRKIRHNEKNLILLKYASDIFKTHLILKWFIVERHKRYCTIMKKIYTLLSWKVWSGTYKIRVIHQILLVNKPTRALRKTQKLIYDIPAIHEALVYNLHEVMTCLKQGIKALLLPFLFCKIRARMLYCSFVISDGWVVLSFDSSYSWNNGTSRWAELTRF